MNEEDVNNLICSQKVRAAIDKAISSPEKIEDIIIVTYSEDAIGLTVSSIKMEMLGAMEYAKKMLIEKF